MHDFLFILLICATLTFFPLLEARPEKERSNSRFTSFRHRVSGRRGETSRTDFDLEAFIGRGSFSGGNSNGTSSAGGSGEGKSTSVISKSSATVDEGVASAVGTSAGVAAGEDNTGVNLKSNAGVNDNEGASAAESSAMGSSGASASSGHSAVDAGEDKLTFGAVAASVGVSLGGTGGASSGVSGQDTSARGRVGSGVSNEGGDIFVSTSLSALGGGQSRGSGRTDIFGESSSFGILLDDDSEENEEK